MGDIEDTNRKLQENFIPAEPNKDKSESENDFKFAGVVRMDNDLIFKTEHIRIRVASMVLNKQNPDTDFIPLVNSFASYRQPKPSTTALHFILEKLPVPATDTPWEEVLDFRSDEDVKRKYYALLNWINQVVQKDMPVSHFIDHYNSLYSEYTRQYSLHKLNSRFTTMELLITAGMEFVAALSQNNYVSAIKDLLSFRKNQVALLKQEKEIEGRELAYIFSANQHFS